jgi:hypothetical protein
VSDTKDPGPRPADPSKISFARECFEETGTVTEYYVPRMAPNYPVHFGPDKAGAEAYAKTVKGEVFESTRILKRRIKWY